MLSYGNVDESKIRVGQLREGGLTQVNRETFPEQAFRWPAIRDFYNHAAVGMRDDDLRAEIVKPRCPGELVGIEPLTIGHRQVALLLPIPRRPVGSLTGQA